MALYCSCGHNRLEHIWGDRLSDSSVHKCTKQDCTCGKYHGREGNDNSYVLRFALRVTVVIACGFAAFMVLYVAATWTLDQYTLEPVKTQEDVFLVYANGTKVNNNTPDFDHRDNAISLILAGGFFAFYIFGGAVMVMFVGSIYDMEKRKVIHSP